MLIITQIQPVYNVWELAKATALVLMGSVCVHVYSLGISKELAYCMQNCCKLQ